MKHDNPQPLGRLLRIEEVSHQVGLSRTTIARRIKDGSFPRAGFVFSVNCKRWAESEIEAWKHRLAHPDPHPD